MSITEEKSEKQWFFLCGRWLSKDEDDGEIIREIPVTNEDGTASEPLTSYKITVFTGDRRGAGTGIHYLFTTTINPTKMPMFTLFFMEIKEKVARGNWKNLERIYLSAIKWMNLHLKLLI